MKKINLKKYLWTFLTASAISTANANTVPPVMTCANANTVNTPNNPCNNGGCSGNQNPTGNPSCNGGNNNNTTPNQSLVDNLTYNFIHDATDFTTESSFTACKTCGDGKAPTSELPQLGLYRSHQFRNMSQTGSFGPGTFMHWDRTMSLYQVGETPQIDYFEPFNTSLKRYFFEADGKFVESVGLSTDRLEIFDQNNLRLTDPQEIFEKASYGIIYSNLNEQFKFEFFTVDSFLKRARIVSYTNRYGYSINISYQDSANDTSTGEKSKLRIAAITDANNRQLIFSYATEMKRGQFVVSSIQLPNGSAINYNYAAGSDGLLSTIDFPDGTQSTFSASATANGMTKMSIFEATQKGMHRKKDAYLHNNFVSAVLGDGIELYNQSSLLINRIEKGGELSYQVYGHPTRGNIRLVYEGGNRLKRFGEEKSPVVTLNNQEISPELFTQDKTYNDFSFSFEETFEYVGGNNPYNSRIPSFRDDYGRSYNYKFDAKGEVIEKTFPDGSKEEFKTNIFRQYTFEKDRLGRVTRREYNSVGQETKEEVGLRFAGYQITSVPALATFSFDEDVDTDIIDSTGGLIATKMGNVSQAVEGSEEGSKALYFDGQDADLKIPNDGRFDTP